jgi:hypothetical protein
MELKNEYIVIGIIIIITVFFIINYDVYVLPKNEPLCKPIYVTKKIIDDKIIKKLKNPKESFISLKNKNNFNKENKKIINKKNKEIIDEKHEVILNEENEELCIDTENIEEENINQNNIVRKKIIINNILNILPNIPTRLNNDEIHDIINHVSEIYLASTSMAQFYNSVNNSNKISSVNSNYIKLILYLIDNFDSSLPMELEPKINKSLENNKSKAENDDNMFLISNSNSPIQNRMIQQASFIR